MKWWVLLLAGCSQLFGLKHLPDPDAAPDAPPPGQWASIATGARHACGLDKDGHLACWGDAIAGGGTITPTRIGTATWTEISAGGRHTCGVSDGHALCWGSNYNAQITGAFGPDAMMPTQVPLPAAAPPVDHVAAGMYHSCALAGGQLWCWGRNDLNGGSTAQMPVQLAAGTSFTAVSAGLDHGCAIDTSGGVWCWGRDDAGQASGMTCGVATGCVVLQPTQVMLPMPAIAVSAGRQATCALLGSGGQGQIYCWGVSDVIKVGTGVTPPVLATPGSDWTGVVVGNREACGLRGGQAYCWGTVYAGGLGDGVWIESILPTATLTAIPADSIALSRSQDLDESACAIREGNVSCWGENRGGQLTTTATLHVAPAMVVAPMGTWAHLAMSDHHACALDSDGHVLCWGDDGEGEISGSACTHPPCMQPMPAAAAVATADQVTVGAEYTCTRTSTSVTCFGGNQYGELGAAGALTMHQLTVPQGTTLAGGELGLCALGNNANLCWGAGNPTPQAPAGVPPLLDIGVGNASCGVTTSSQRGCWGLPIWGQLGDGVNDVNMPAKGWTQIAEGGVYHRITTQHGHSCATVDATGPGNVKCWGTNYNGETSSASPGLYTLTPTAVTVDGSSTPVQGCSAVSTGATATCAICNNLPVCWGAAYNGNLGNGIESNQIYGATPVEVDSGRMWTEVGNGDQHACALSSDGTLVCWGLGIRGEVGDGSHGSSVPVMLPPPP